MKVQCRIRKAVLEENAWGLLFISLSMLGFLVFSIYPLFSSVRLSFYQYRLIGPSEYVGFSNFRELIQDPLFWRSLRQTFYYMILVVPVRTALAIALAIILNRTGGRSTTCFRTIYYLPVVTSEVATAYVWRWMFNPEIGLINHVLATVGVNGPGWLSSPSWAMPAVALIAVWRGIGWAMVVFLAGLQNIPQTYYEAADIDGATGLQKSLYITLPLLSPTTFFVITMALIGTFQVFTDIFLLTSGGPLNSTMVLAYYIYSSAFRDLRMGYACAAAWVMFVIIFVLTLVQFKYAKTWVHTT